MKILLITLLLFYSGVSAADIFKCIDSKGTVNYSDQPCKRGASSTVLKKRDLEKKEITLLTPFSSLRSRLSTHIYELIFAAYALMSALSYFCYFIDKQAAQTGQRRIPEIRLHTFELIGGWPGALLAQHILRHKNRKRSYQLVFWLIVGLHATVWLDYLKLNHFLFNSLTAYLSIKTIA